jgi:hypothetical protein
MIMVVKMLKLGKTDRKTGITLKEGLFLLARPNKRLING